MYIKVYYIGGIKIKSKIFTLKYLDFETIPNFITPDKILLGDRMYLTKSAIIPYQDYINKEFIKKILEDD